VAKHRQRRPPPFPEIISLEKVKFMAQVEGTELTSLADAIDDGETKTGLRINGVLYSVRAPRHEEIRFTLVSSRGDPAQPREIRGKGVFSYDVDVPTKLLYTIV
jgi:hypothetical protein